MGTFNYNTYDYEFKRALLLIKKCNTVLDESDKYYELKNEISSIINENYEKVFPIERTLEKYSGSTLNGNKITKLVIYPIGEVHVYTEKESKVFDISCEELEYRSADNIICEIQNESGINVSKY